MAGSGKLGSFRQRWGGLASQDHPAVGVFLRETDQLRHAYLEDTGQFMAINISICGFGLVYDR